MGILIILRLWFMTGTLAFVIVFVPLFSRYKTITDGVILPFAFLADVVGAAHKKGVAESVSYGYNPRILPQSPLQEDNLMPRTAPQEVVDRWNAWKHWSSVWNWIHYLTGFTSAALAVLIAANTKDPFLPIIPAVLISCFGAGLAFLVTSMGAQTKGKGFELAGRVLEGAIAEYENDDSVPAKSLADAIQKGLDVLNNVK